MPDRAWKRAEREAAALLGGTRHVRKDFSESAEDVEHECFAIECKYRKALPKLVMDGLNQAKKNGRGKLPLLFLKERGRHGGIVCVRSQDFKRILDGELSGDRAEV